MVESGETQKKSILGAYSVENWKIVNWSKNTEAVGARPEPLSKCPRVGSFFLSIRSDNFLYFPVL